jgi:DNA-binding transcriptional ArsR family regulator
MASRKPPALLPLLRTDAQARILTAIVMDPEREWSVSELAEEVGVSAMTASREIRLAEDAGLVETHRLGTTKLVSANRNSPYFESLSNLLLVAFGPLPVLREALADVDGVEEAYIFGSWAERYSGRPGADPVDVDLLVVGDVDRAAVYESIEGSERDLGREVQVTFRTLEQWNDQTDPFIATVRSRTLVPVVAPDDEVVIG